MSRFAIHDTIEQLDPIRDHQRIVHLSSCCDFSFDTTRALRFALFRTFGVPSISALLDRTGEFTLRPHKRYEGTNEIIRELMEWGYDSERGRRALNRINQQHGRFSITNEDFLYVLSTFIFAPIRWNQHFGWRVMSEKERLASFYFWREIGLRMGIKDIPTEYEVFERFNRDYESNNFRFTESNRRVGSATVALFVSWFPKPVAPLIRYSIYSLLDDSLLLAFGFPRPSNAMRRFVHGAVRLRGLVTSFFPRILGRELPFPD